MLPSINGERVIVMETWMVYCLILCVGTLIVAGIAIGSDAQKSPSERQAEIDRARQRYEQDKLSRKIVEVKLLDGGSTTYKRGGLGGAAFGGFIGGAPGAIVGAVLPSGKGVQKQKFAVKYANGEVAVREYAPGTSEYNALMKYVKWEEI